MKPGSHILITGGSGYVGSHLVRFLTALGYQTAILSRAPKNSTSFKSYKWSVENGFIEEGAIEKASHIIHLAGANISDKRWTKSRKKELYESRISGALLLYKKLCAVSHQVEAVISASAVGIYGDTGNGIVDETFPPKNDFMGNMCRDWESVIDRIKELNIRTVKLRSGIVLGKDCIFLNAFRLPLLFNILPVLGSGDQYVSWIHIEDMCRIVFKSITDKKFRGVYNAVSPEPVAFKTLIRRLPAARAFKPFILNVPAWALRVGMGEMAQAVLMSSRVSCRKIEDSGYQFRFKTLEETLAQIRNKSGKGNQ